MGELERNYKVVEDSAPLVREMLVLVSLFSCDEGHGLLLLSLHRRVLCADQPH